MKPSIRVDGENVHLGDQVVVSFTHPCGPVVGLVGEVKRLVIHDETTGELVDHRRMMIEDNRTGDSVEIHTRWIERIRTIDGPYMSQDEVNATVGAHRPKIAKLFEIAVQLTGDLDELSEDPVFAGASEIAAQAHDVAGALRATLDALSDQ